MVSLGPARSTSVPEAPRAAAGTPAPAAARPKCGFEAPPVAGLPPGVPVPPAGSNQLVTVLVPSASSTSGVLRGWQRGPGGEWITVLGPVTVRVGVLGPPGPQVGGVIAQFWLRLGELGYVAGQNLVQDERID